MKSLMISILMAAVCLTAVANTSRHSNDPLYEPANIVQVDYIWDWQLASMGRSVELIPEYKYPCTYISYTPPG